MSKKAKKSANKAMAAIVVLNTNYAGFSVQVNYLNMVDIYSIEISLDLTKKIYKKMSYKALYRVFDKLMKFDDMTSEMCIDPKNENVVICSFANADLLINFNIKIK